MVPALLPDVSRLLTGHLTVGCSTGYMTDARGDWPALVARAAATSGFAVELSALSEAELPGLAAYLAAEPPLPFHYVSVHAPSKGRRWSEPELVERLLALPWWVDAVVVHPDAMRDPAAYRPLGRALLIENMDARKPAGRTAHELSELFAALPEAGLCFDVAHAKAVDPSLEAGAEILDHWGDRLRHVHLSSLDADGHHIPLTEDDETAFAPLMARCRDVPWILEAPPPER